MAHQAKKSTAEARLARIEKALDRIERSLKRLAVMEVEMARELEALTEQVKKQEDVERSAVTLIVGLASRITAAGTDPAKLAALTAELKSSADALAAAIVANTPAET